MSESKTTSLLKGWAGSYMEECRKAAHEGMRHSLRLNGYKDPETFWEKIRANFSYYGLVKR